MAATALRESRITKTPITGQRSTAIGSPSLQRENVDAIFGVTPDGPIDTQAQRGNLPLIP